MRSRRFSSVAPLGLLAVQALFHTGCLDIDSTPSPEANLDQSVTEPALAQESSASPKLECHHGSGTCDRLPTSEFTQACTLDVEVELTETVPREYDWPKDDRGEPTEDYTKLLNKKYVAWNLLGADKDKIADLVNEIALQVCAELYRSPDEVKIHPTKKLVLSFQPNRYAPAWLLDRGDSYYLAVSTLHKFVKDYEANQDPNDIKGMLAHELTHVFQYGDADGEELAKSFEPAKRAVYQVERSQVIEGMADYVRTQTGWVRNFKERVAQDLGSWEDPKIVEDNGELRAELRGPNYQALGWFFTWLEHQQPGVTHRLNQSLSSTDNQAWTFDVFKKPSVAGESVRLLWDEYRDWARQPSCNGCGDENYCEYLIAEQCGEKDLGMARCVPKPHFCTDEFEPVCGCDGETYTNACKASQAGVSLRARTDCQTFVEGLRPPD